MSIDNNVVSPSTVKSLERELQEANARIATLADSTGNLLWMCDASGERNFFNQKWLQFTGRSLAEELCQGWLNNVFPPHIPRVKETFKRAFFTLQNYRIEYRLKAADGRYRTVLESGSAQFTQDGTFAGYIGWCADIEQTRMTQHGIATIYEATADTYAGTNDNSPIGIWKLDRKLTIVKVNPAAIVQLGVQPGSLEGKNFTQVVSSAFETALHEVLASGKKIHLRNQQLLVQSSTERLVFWDVDVWPLTNEHEQVIGAGVATTDVTERRRIEQQKEDFVATLVHDLKTPLIGADCTLHVLINGGLGQVDSDQLHALKILKNSNRQLLSVVQNLIEVYKFESGVPGLNFEAISSFELIASTILEFSMLANEKGITLTPRLPQGLGNIMADRFALRRLFQNLLDNAIKFTPSSGRIDVTASEERDAVNICVRDTGIGITSEEEAQLFKRFSQGSRGKTLAPGTGLGLYLCKQIVEAHGGTLTFSSQQDEGTTFCVRLPRSGSET
jgi:PAS domain S-box-containing protein